MIHPTAIIHPKAALDATVRVGPFAVIDAGVELGAGCVVGPHVYLTGLTTAGTENRFHAGCVIGDAPQDLKYKDEPTRLRIGDDNVFREHVTVHRSTKLDAETVIGSHNFLMANSHVGAQLHRRRPCDSGQRRAAGRARGGAGSRVHLRQLPGASILPRRHAGDDAGRRGHQQGSAAVLRGVGQKRNVRIERRRAAPRRVFGGSANGIEAALPSAVSRRKKFARGAGTRRGKISPAKRQRKC